MNKDKNDHFGSTTYGNWDDEKLKVHTAESSGSKVHNSSVQYRLDSSIYEDVCEAFLNHPEIDTSDFKVIVREGVVILDGLVGTREAKKITEAVVDVIPGVFDVQNNLRIQNNGQSIEKDIREVESKRIKNPLIRNETGLI